MPRMEPVPTVPAPWIWKTLFGADAADAHPLLGPTQVLREIRVSSARPGPKRAGRNAPATPRRPRLRRPRRRRWWRSPGHAGTTAGGRRRNRGHDQEPPGTLPDGAR